MQIITKNGIATVKNAYVLLIYSNNIPRNL